MDVGSLSDILPSESIISIALNLPISIITNLCQTNFRFNSLICENDWFWKQIFIRELGQPNIQPISSWKQLYQDYGILWGMGYNNVGQLGLGDQRDVKVPTKIPISMPVKSVAAGESHSMVIDINNDIWAFGDGRNGQLGLFHGAIYQTTPFKLPNIKGQMTGCGFAHTVIIDLENNIWSTGSNRDGQLGINVEYNEIGLGLNPDRYIPVQILNPVNKAIFVSCGSHHTLIIDMDNNVWATGRNKFGQLGLGDNVSRYTFTPVGMKAKMLASG